MPYSSRTLVAALLLLSTAQAGLKALALPLPPLVAQTSTTFPVPDDVPAGTTLSIQSSPNLGIATRALKDGFERTYDGTEIAVDVTDSDQALQALQNGEIDLAAIGRPLTEEEAAAGFVTVPLERAKIAIIVGPNNPFEGDLTFEQFAAMFRGEITDWSEVGGAPGPIRFVDRPENSDTRRSLSQYEVFQNAPFERGATAAPVAEDDTATVIRALGDDGISYAIAPHVLNRPGVKIVPMHQTLPDNPAYPYSQPRFFVYRGQPTPAVAAFLGYVASPQGTETLSAAQQTEVDAVTTALGTVGAAAAGTDAAGTDAAGSDATGATGANAAGTDAAGSDATGATGADAAGTDAAGTDGATESDGATGAAPGEATDAAAAERGGFAWWWLLPLAAGLVGALAWASGRRGAAPAGTPAPGGAVPTPPPVPPVDGAAAVTATPPATPNLAAAVPPEAAIPTAPVTAAPLEADPWLDAAPAAAAGPEPVVADISEPVAAEVPEPVVAEVPEPVVAEIPEPPAAPAIEETPVPQPSAVPVMAVATGMAGLAAGAAGLAAGAAAAMASTEDQTDIEASKFNVVGHPTDGDIDLSSIDDGLPPLPDGYGESRIVLMPRDPQWAYAYWDTPHTHKEDLRRQGGERLALRLYDVTDIDRSYQAPHGMQQCDCDELARDWYLQIPVSDRDYQAEIGYLTGDGRWLMLARSNTIRIPPIYPSDWSEDHFKTVTWEEDLRGKTLMTLVDPNQKSRSLHEQMYAISQAGEAERVDGSLYGSMQHVPGSVPHVPGSAQQVAGSIQHIPGSVQHVAGSIQHVAGSMAPYQSAESSYAWGASGAGLLQGMPGPGSAVPTMSGISSMSGVGMGVNMSGVGMSGVNVSGLNMSGISGLTMSGVGFSASMPPARPRKFWLVADAELIVYGATEPDATVTIAGQPIQLSPEGTFRIHTSFPDGNIDYPIMAVAADGEQHRSIHMTFDRQTPDRRTNTKEEAQDEWFQG